jgi:superfamily II DNA or RNA helicase
VPATLYDLIPRDGRPGNDLLLERFLDYVSGRQLQLYPAQESAILEIFDDKNVILNTPTGSGKSLVATALHFQAIAQGRRSIYTCPIKALVNEKFIALCREFGPDNIGLSTGDASVNRDAPILCCTAEILANIALREGAAANVREVVMDEFHYYADRERGVAWQVPLLTLPQARFLLMSATLGDTTFFEAELTRLTGRPTATVSSTDRPVPLAHEYSELPLAKTLESLVAAGRAPVYVVHFTQLEAAQSAQDFTSINVCSRDEKAAIANTLEGFKFTSPYGPEIKKWLRHGIGLHHAGLLPKYRVLVEQLAQKGLLKVICGTDTLGVGINVPIRTVLFTRLCKFDGQKTGILSARDFHQISGRAGRKGFDDQGWVVAQAPEHVIENLKLAEKTARDGKKTVKRQPPEKNFVNWDKNTFARLIVAPPERLASRFQVTHGMLLNVLSRVGDGCAAMQKLIRDCHETPKAKKAHTQRAWQLFRSLLNRKIVEFISPRSGVSAERRQNSETDTERQNAKSESEVRPHPNLLPQEREQEAMASVSSTANISNPAPDIAETQEPIPPLPGGEGPGEDSPNKLSIEPLNQPNVRFHQDAGSVSPSPGGEGRGEGGLPAGLPSNSGRKLRVNVELQDDFSMDQVLSLYLLETIPLMDPQAPDYALVLLTLVESILEDPDIILRKQLDKVKDRKMAEMKMEGIEYEQRMEELEKLEHPKPNREFVYSTFNEFAARHPWVGEENIHPKSIVREMFEEFRSFADYIKLYELQRAEGVLLRHLNSVFKVLAQTVPDTAKNDQLREMELYLATMIRQVDSSLLDEWEKMRDPNYRAGETKEVRPPGAEEAAADITRDPKAFTAAIRNRIFTFLRGLVIEDYEQAIAGLNSPADADSQPWTAARLQQALDDYHTGHEHICLDPNARNLRHTYVVPADDKKSWRVQQMLVDPEENNDWVAEFDVDLAESRKLGEPFLRLRRIGSLT